MPWSSAFCFLQLRESMTEALSIQCISFCFLSQRSSPGKFELQIFKPRENIGAQKMVRVCFTLSVVGTGTCH